MTDEPVESVWQFVHEVLERLPDDFTHRGLTKEEIVNQWEGVMGHVWDEPYEVMLVRPCIAEDFGVRNPYHQE